MGEEGEGEIREDSSLHLHPIHVYSAFSFLFEKVLTHIEAMDPAFFPSIGDSDSSGVGDRSRQRVAVRTRSS